MFHEGRGASSAAKLFHYGPRLPFLVPLSAYATAIADEDVPLDRFIAGYAEDRGMGEPVGPMLEKALAEGESGTCAMKGALTMCEGRSAFRTES